jgi:conjugative relaxase-like TrwC/TraI family protein
MSLARSISASNAEKYYYEKDPILVKEPDGNSRWQGQGAEKLGLSGQISKDTFVKILDGRHPETGQRLVAIGVNGEHRSGMDFVFSPPKSVSIYALHGGHAEILKAHQEAARETIKHIETIVTARSTEDGQTKYQNTGNVVAATFMHSTSRANDPQLHTHTIIMNMTESNGEWKAVSNESLFLSQNIINQVYQNHLAKNIVELGYNIDRKGSSFELSGFKQEWIDQFSKRSDEVTKYLNENIDKLREQYPEASEQKLKDLAILASRDEKDKSITAAELKDLWESQVSRDSMEQAVSNSIEQQIQNYSLEKTAELITENQSTFTREQLVETYLKLNVGSRTIEDFEKELQKSFANEQIQKVGEVPTRIGTRTINLPQAIYTTANVIETEKAILNTIEHQNNINAYMQPEQMSQHLENTSLTAGQQKLVEHIATTDKQFSFIQGDAGTGKTHALDMVAKILQQESDVKIIGASFTGKAAAEIEEKTNGNIQSQTLHSLLNNWDQHIKPDQASILIVDEASMISSKQFSSIIEHAQDTDTRVIFIGDTKQLQPIAAGQIFKDSIEKFGADVVLSENLRQQTSLTQEVVESIKDYHQGINYNGMHQAFSSLSANDKIHEQSDFTSKAIEDYISNIQANKETLLLTHKNDLKDELNLSIRDRLLDNNSERFELTVREQINISQTDKFNSHSYEAGQSIFITAAIENFKAGSEWQISSIDNENNSLNVINPKGYTESINLSEHGNHISAFTEQTKEFAIGDKIVFEKNDYLLDVKNGQTGQIESYENGILSINKDNGESVNFKPANYNYLDYGYALTVHKAQGQTCDTVQYVTESNDKMINSESFYVTMTRATDDIHIYTDDADKLADRASIHENEISLHDMLENTNEHETEMDNQIEF